MKKVIFAGGCFWGVEAYFKLVEGVKETSVGYADGPFPTPSYEQVCAASGHVEAVEVTYDERELPFTVLLEHYFNIVDPTAVNRQGPDIGRQYRSGFYNLSSDEVTDLKAFIAHKQLDYLKPIVIEIKDGVRYDLAEPYHQDYLAKNPGGYCHVNLGTVKNVSHKR